jgi:hypothetical protein
VIVDAFVAGLGVAVLIGVGLGYSGWNRWIGAGLGPAAGLGIIVGARVLLSNASLNPHDGGDVSARIWSEAIGVALIAMYATAYAVGAVVRWGRRHRHRPV